MLAILFISSVVIYVVWSEWIIFLNNTYMMKDRRRGYRVYFFDRLKFSLAVKQGKATRDIF